MKEAQALLLANPILDAYYNLCPFLPALLVFKENDESSINWGNSEDPRVTISRDSIFWVR